MNAHAPHITYYPEMDQGSEAWLAERCGMLTASEMKNIMTPTGKVADNDKTRAHVYELAAQRLTGFVEPRYISDDMMRGHADEIDARIAYEKAYGGTSTVGFIVNSKWGFPIGFSPDWLVGKDGLAESKSRAQRFQVQTIAEYVSADTIPGEFMLQCQTGLLVSERAWLDFCSYSNGMPMAVIRVMPIQAIQDAIIAAATAFEAKVAAVMQDYRSALASGARLIPTERKIQMEVFL